MDFISDRVNPFDEGYFYSDVLTPVNIESKLINLVNGNLF